MSLPCKINPLGRGETSSLPAGYLPARFLESTGTQYIHTNVWVTNNTGCAIGYTRSARYGSERYLLSLRSLSAGQGTDNFWYPPIPREGNAGKSWRMGFGKVYEIPVEEQIPLNTRLDVRHNFKNSSNAQLNGETALTFDRALYTEDNYTKNPLVLFGFVNDDVCPWANALWQGKVYYCCLTEGAQETRHYTPAVDAQGVPCLYDKITKQPFYNSGSGAFIVGMTTAQARKLGNLPEDTTTKELTVSLPAAIVDGETVTDDAVQAALDAAAANGWTITIQTYTD